MKIPAAAECKGALLPLDERRNTVVRFDGMTSKLPTDSLA